MYITKDDHFGYYRGSEQCVTRGRFLLLLQPNKYKEPNHAGTMHLDIQASCSPENTFAVVRRVALRQLGAFMMGRANLCGKWHTVSGAYGSDGLPMSVDKLPHDAVPLPRELYDAWSKGGGWNSAGAESRDMRRWAYETFKGR
jgi:hypothetical protein